MLAPYDGQIVVTGGAVSVTGPVALHLGRLAAQTELCDTAVGHLRDAATIADRLDARGWAAMARAELGAVLLDTGNPAERAEAETLLRDAAEAADAIGMNWLAEHARSRLPATNPPIQAFRRDGELWELGYAGHTIRLPDAKGLHDIATLLAHPGSQIPAAKLIGVDAAAEASYGADDLLDHTARTAYRQRLADLDADIDIAEAAHDPERAALARAEKDRLVEALAAAYGKGRRPRRLGDANERARKTVTARIRDSIARITARHPSLGEHLNATIRTGVLCSYQEPTGAARWRL
jgi:hypothetical protein